MAVREIGADGNSCPTEWFVSFFERAALPGGGQVGGAARTVAEKDLPSICQASAKPTSVPPNTLSKAKLKVRKCGGNSDGSADVLAEKEAKVKYTVVAPCFNESDRIERMLRETNDYFKSLNETWEFVCRTALLLSTSTSASASALQCKTFQTELLV